MTGRDSDERRRHAIAADSNELIERLGELKELEVTKRGTTMSTPAFHRLAEEITERSREIFRLADHEERTGDELSETQESSIDDEAGPGRDGTATWSPGGTTSGS